MGGSWSSKTPKILPYNRIIIVGFINLSDHLLFDSTNTCSMIWYRVKCLQLEIYSITQRRVCFKKLLRWSKYPNRTVSWSFNYSNRTFIALPGNPLWKILDTPLIIVCMTCHTGMQGSWSPLSKQGTDHVGNTNAQMNKVHSYYCSFARC